MAARCRCVFLVYPRPNVLAYKKNVMDGWDSVDEYGNVTYSFDSIDNTLLYAGDRIDAETGVYESEIFNGSNQLVSWRSIIWDTTEPVGTSITIQVRSAASEDDISSATWSDDLIKNSEGYASIEYVKDQFMQFRVILISRVFKVNNKD
jgi:hypothetical protein